MFDLKLLRAEIFTCNHWEKDIPILNPGDWFGKARVLSVEGGYVPLRLVVEADGFSEAIDVLADHETYKREVVIPEVEYGDYGTRALVGWTDLWGTQIDDRTLIEADFAGNDSVPCRTSHVDELCVHRRPGVPEPILYTHPDWTALKTMSPQAYDAFQNISSFEDTLYWVHKYAPLHHGETEVSEDGWYLNIVRGGDKGESIDVEVDYPEIYRQYQRAQAKKSDASKNDQS